ncbi:flavin reductase like domain-containing protein [Aspergillus crustosus]
MKLLHTRALLSARGVRSYRPIGDSLISQVSRHQWCPHRALTTSTPPPPSPSPPPKDQNDTLDQSLSTQVRLLMRRVPYPVAIITSTDPNPPSSSSSPPASNFRGMTVSSFNTVTLTPKPVISFNVRRPSETLNALLKSGRFLVHLLSPGQGAAALASDFAKGNWSRLSESENGFGADATGERFEFVPLDGSQTPSRQISEQSPKTEKRGKKNDTDTLPPLPLLRRKNASEQPNLAISPEPTSIPFIFECRLLPESIVNVYDHTIVVGTVVRAITDSHSGSHGTNMPATTESGDLCLMYANTRFWKAGGEV